MVGVAEFDDRFGEFFEIFGQVLLGEAEAAEQDGGAFEVERAGGYALEDDGDAGLDGAAIFRRG